MTVPDSAWTDVWALISDEPALVEDGDHGLGRLHRLCRAATHSLPALGVGVTVMSDEGSVTGVAAAGPRCDLVEELQFTLGEGPCLDAYHARAPVLVPSLVSAASRWPAYAPAAGEHGVRAVFAFPMQVGSARLGALDVYRGEPGALSERALQRALTFTEVALTILLDAQQRSDADPAADEPSAGALDDVLDGRLEVYQAQGMVMFQLGVSLSEAMARLRAYAFAHERSLSDVALDIVSRRLVLEADES